MKRMADASGEIDYEPDLDIDYCGICKEYNELVEMEWLLREGGNVSNSVCIFLCVNRTLFSAALSHPPPLDRFPIEKPESALEDILCR